MGWDKRAAIPEPRWDDNGVGTVDVADIPWWPGEIDAIRLQFGATQTVSSYFMTDWVAIGRPTPGAGVALVQEEARARVAADVAEASKRETLAVQLRGDYEGSDLSQVPSGLFAAERDARVTADEANASAIEVIQARMPTGDGTVATEASVTEERQARADGDSANAEAIGRVSARMPAGDARWPLRKHWMPSRPVWKKLRRDPGGRRQNVVAGSAGDVQARRRPGLERR